MRLRRLQAALVSGCLVAAPLLADEPATEQKAQDKSEAQVVVLEKLEQLGDETLKKLPKEIQARIQQKLGAVTEPMEKHDGQESKQIQVRVESAADLQGLSEKIQQQVREAMKDLPEATQRKLEQALQKAQSAVVKAGKAQATLPARINLNAMDVSLGEAFEIKGLEGKIRQAIEKAQALQVQVGQVAKDEHPHAEHHHADGHGHQVQVRVETAKDASSKEPKMVRVEVRGHGQEHAHQHPAQTKAHAKDKAVAIAVALDGDDVDLKEIHQHLEAALKHLPADVKQKVHDALMKAHGHDAKPHAKSEGKDHHKHHHKESKRDKHVQVESKVIILGEGDKTGKFLFVPQDHEGKVEYHFEVLEEMPEKVRQALKKQGDKPHAIFMKRDGGAHGKRLTGDNIQIVIGAEVDEEAGQDKDSATQPTQQKRRVIVLGSDGKKHEMKADWVGKGGENVRVFRVQKDVKEDDAKVTEQPKVAVVRARDAKSAAVKAMPRRVAVQKQSDSGLEKRLERVEQDLKEIKQMLKKLSDK